jgi:hypothetical protein
VVLLHLGEREVISILLSGSLARGEGVWKAADGGYRILSDLDMLVLTRWEWTMPSALRCALEGISRQSGVSVDVRLAPRIRLLLYPRDVDTFDLREHGIILHGQGVERWLPLVCADSLSFADIAFSFFNEVILSIEELSPADMAASTAEGLSCFSERAAKTLLTCASMLCIYAGNYQPTMQGRFAYITSTQLALLGIPDLGFTEDLRDAYSYRFDRPYARHLPDALAYWRRARRHLARIFQFCLAARHGTGEISAYPRLAWRDMPATEWVRDFYKRLHVAALMLGEGYVPRWSGLISSSQYCRMAALMLYLAIDTPVNAMLVGQAEAYLSKCYRRRSTSRGCLQPAWYRARDELAMLHSEGAI